MKHNCAHCNGLPVLNVGEYKYQYSDHNGYEYYYVACTDCGIRTKEVRYKYFCEISGNTVGDYRKNPCLRLDDEKLLEEHLSEKKVEAWALWNERVDPWYSSSVLPDSNYPCICRLGDEQFTVGYYDKVWYLNGHPEGDHTWRKL